MVAGITYHKSQIIYPTSFPYLCLMSKKLSKITDYFEGFHMYAIVSPLKDYSLGFHINNNLGFHLASYEDIYFDMASDPDKGFSWYYYEDVRSHTHYYLIGNKSDGSFLIPAQKTVDYLLLIKDALDDQAALDSANAIRKIPNVSAVFSVDMNKVKDMDVFMETIELHELEFVKRSK